ncbi:hypothetical protein [Salinispora pacifica]|uniref:hypothetical protein n=1 Tax=Salinispora pacifica TaxID=351187 RepID=UPI00048620A1|nr:hypothetical protein [Salinispora pacifica]
MASLVNSFEGGLDGLGITTGNSGGGSGDAWTLAADTADGTCTYSSTGAAHGSLCMSVTLGATTGPQRRGWAVNDGNATSVQHFRFYLDPASISGGAVSVLRGMNAGSTGQRFRVQVSDSGVLTLRNNISSVVWTSTALSAGTQWRVEVSAAGSTSGVGRVRVYAGDSTSTTQDSGDLTALNLGGPIREVWFGQTSATAGVSVRLDDCGWSDTALLGPASDPVAVNATSVSAAAATYGSTPTAAATYSSTPEVADG